MSVIHLLLLQLFELVNLLVVQHESVKLSLVSTDTSFVTLGSMSAGVRRSPLQPVLHCEYFMLCVHFRNYPTRLLLPVSGAHRVFKT